MISNTPRRVAILLSAAVVLPAALSFVACDKGPSSEGGDKPAVTLAPTATALAPAKPPPAGATKLKIETASSKVDFLMEAPKEKIAGHVPGTTTGELSIDLDDVTRSTGALMVDLSTFKIYQTAVDKDGKLGEEKFVERQNEHAKNWLEIGEDAPADKKKDNSIIHFSIKSIEVAGEKSLLKLTGAERKLSLKVTGDFLLHGRKAQKVATLAGTFKFNGDKLVGASFKTEAPFGVDLAEHDVKPRDGFGKLALKTLEALSPKVAKEALVSFDFSAVP